MGGANLNTVIHLAGFGAGVALYGLLAVMTRDAPARGDRLALATAVLGLLWNAGALVAFGAADLGLGAAPPLLAWVAYAALGGLPAVAVHAASAGLATRPRRWVVGAGYAAAVVAAGVHAVAMVRGTALPSRDGLLVVTVASLALVVALVASSGPEARGRRLSLAALAAFAVMAFHLGGHAESREGWAMALVGHHASLPLAVAVLYLDYRFALADVFLKRALTLVLLAAVAGALLLGVALPALDGTGDGATGIVVTLACWVATAAAAPALARAVSRGVDRVLLRRRAPDARLGAFLERLARVESAAAALTLACEEVAEALDAPATAWGPPATREPAGGAVSVGERGRSATVAVVPVEGAAYELRVGALGGGRRLLSEDRQFLEAVAIAVARRIDALRVADERHARDLREESLRRLSSEAELQALRAQLNPHFLFNALTTLGYLMREAPDRATSALYNLTSLLRAVLVRSHGEATTLGEEFALVRDYLAIEEARFEERLAVALELPPELAACEVPPLVLQPLVENAIKHGIAPLARGGRVAVRARLAGGGLELVVEDSGAGTAAATAHVPSHGGVGLANLHRRLERLHGDAASLAFRSAPGEGTRVVVRLPAGGARAWRAAS